jgi:hypothetical protein
MKIEELAELFNQCLAEKKAFSPCLREPNTPYGERQYSLFSLDNLPEFVRLLKGLHEDQPKRSVRYIVTEQNRLLLAREGKPGRHIPEHKEMSSYVRAAGNLYFTPDHTAFNKISHESGDFCLDPSSLVWPIALLIAQNVPLTPTFTIEIKTLNVNNEFVADTEFHLTPAQLRSLLPNGFEDIINTPLPPPSTSGCVTPPPTKLRKRPRYEDNETKLQAPSISLFADKNVQNKKLKDNINTPPLSPEYPPVNDLSHPKSRP